MPEKKNYEKRSDSKLKPSGLLRLFALLSLTAILIFSAGNVGASEWNVAYYGTALPESSSPPWTAYAIGTQSASADNGILQLNASGGTSYVYYANSDSTLTNRLGTAIEARLKVFSSGNSGYDNFVYVDDGTVQEALSFYSDRIQLYYTGTFYLMNTTDAFHTYKFIVEGTTAKIQVYVDGILRIDAVGGAAGIAKSVQWGIYQPSGVASSQWDYVRYAYLISNIALNKQTTVNSGTAGSGAVDANLATTWAAFSNSGWIKIDLGQRYSINQTRLLRDASPNGGDVHEILYSIDDVTYTNIDNLTDVLNLVWFEKNYTPFTARYVMINTIASASWVAWYEIEMSGSTILPVAAKFNGTTTNFSTAPNLTSIPVILEITNYGNISWINNVNVDGSDFDANVYLGDKYVSVNSANLDPSFNSTADLAIKNVDCSNYAIYRAPGFYTTLNDIVNNGAVCGSPTCTNIQCSGSILTFRVTGFSSFGAGNPPPVPEFSHFTIVLALAISVLGFFFISQRNKYNSRHK